MAFKLTVLGYAELHSSRAAARHFGVDESESGQPSRTQVSAQEAEDQVHMSAGGVAENGGSPVGRINAALE